MSPLPQTPEPSPRVQFGLFEFDSRSGELRREGQIVKLSPQPARVLGLLLASPGQVVLRDELREHLWGAETFVDFERGLNFCILQVRTALGDSFDNPRFVQTVPRRGYRFIAPVVSSRPAAPDVPVPTTSVAGAQLPTGDRGHEPADVRRLALAALALLVVGGAAAWFTFIGRTASVPAAAHGRVRVAILPFVNLTGNPDVQYLADGLTDEVISQLGRLGADRLAVVARTSAMSYRNSSKGVADIGRELNAAFIVESSVRLDEGGLRIASSLVPTADESPVASWSETFDGEPASAQSPTGAAIRLARLVALAVAPTGDATSSPPPTANLAAWDALLQGHAAMNRGTPDDVKQAAVHFEAATVHDPALAVAWARLAEARHALVMMGAVRPLDAYPGAEEAAARALAADPGLPDAHVARGVVDLWFKRRLAEAAASFERALALNPSHAVAHHDYAWSLLALGRDDEAVAQVTAARDLDPLSIRANTDIGWLFLLIGRPVDAVRACRHTLAIDPRSLEAQACLERAYARRGMHDAALAAARAGLPADAVIPGSAAPDLTAEDTLRLIWRWRIARLERVSQSTWVSPYTLATLFVQVGEHDRAIERLDTAVDQRVGMLTFVSRDPALDPLRPDPRFEALLSRLGAEMP